MSGGTESEGFEPETGSTPEGVTLWKPRGAIEARQLTEDNAVAVADWVSDSGTRCDQFAEPARVHIHEPGVRMMTAEVGDWIVRGTHQWLTCNAQWFAETYEPVSSPDPAAPQLPVTASLLRSRVAAALEQWEGADGVSDPADVVMAAIEPSLTAVAEEMAALRARLSAAAEVTR